jgi:hypothetical protein
MRHLAADPVPFSTKAYQLMLAVVAGVAGWTLVDRDVRSPIGDQSDPVPGPEARGKDIGARNVLAVLTDKEGSRWTACDIFPPRSL